MPNHLPALLSCLCVSPAPAAVCLSPVRGEWDQGAGMGVLFLVWGIAEICRWFFQ